MAIVTGGNRGIGRAIADGLENVGMRVVIGCRTSAPPLDLADLASVRSFASGFERVDLLINNAGVMAPPRRELTRDGFELQFGVNHLGHFALTGLLRPKRVVTVSSMAHHRGRIRFEDLQWQRDYDPFGAYAQSKLANLLFAFELQRRYGASAAAHPGIAATEITRHVLPSWTALLGRVGAAIGFSAQRGAKPILRAALSEEPGYWGPRYFRMFGPPALEQAAPQAYSVEDAEKLWSISVELTGVDF
jgi:NAD(P)-dependent dehydrogenase (short-subunit alcohol dehydrogenase family)